MPKFKLNSIRIRTAKNGCKYVTARIKAEPDSHGTEEDYINFSDSMVQLYEPYLSVEKGGISPIEKEIPIQYTIIYGEYILYKPNQLFFKLHTKDDIAKGIHKGDYVRLPDGKVAVYNSLKVFCHYYIDDITGKKEYSDKQSPEEVGSREFKYRCIPYSKDLEQKLNHEDWKCNDSKHLDYLREEEIKYCDANYKDYDYYYGDEDDSSYDDGLDMNQQSQNYWESNGLF